MKKVNVFYSNFNAPVAGKTPYGTIKDETSPGAKDGSTVLAGMITDFAYAIYQVLNKVGVQPNNVSETLETANLNSQQFINSLEKAFLDRSEFTVKGAIPMGTGSTTKGSEVGYLTGGTDGQIIVKDSGEATGFKFSNRIATELIAGFLKEATQAQTNTGAITGAAVTPSTLSNYTGFSKINFIDTNIVNNQALPGTWTNLDISTVVGSNTCLVMMRVQALTGVADIKFRTDGETFGVGYDIANTPFGVGVSGATMGVNGIAYVFVKTSTAGVIEVRKGAQGTNYSLDVIAYIK